MRERVARQEPMPLTRGRVRDIVRDGLRSPASDLTGEIGRALEARFHFDFSKVRVHTGLDADASARSLGARAYTFGDHIVFAREFGQQASSSPLLVHELSHVVQQSRGANVAQHLLAGSPVPVQRDVDPSTAQPQVVRDVGQMSKGEKLREVIERTGRLLGPEIREKLQELLSPQSIATMVAFGVVWVAAQFFGVGEAADIILAVLGAILLGPEIKKALEDIYAVFKYGLFATSESDLDTAAHGLAQFIAIVGVDVAVAILLHKAMTKAGPGIRAAGESARASSGVTPEGVKIPVPEGPKPEEPMQSRGGGSKAEGETKAPKEEGLTPEKLAVLQKAQLPLSGELPFTPPERWNGTLLELKSSEIKGGYRDAHGCVWTRGPSRTAGQPFEWDVQINVKGASPTESMKAFSKDGAHINVSLDGKVTH